MISLGLQTQNTSDTKLGPAGPGPVARVALHCFTFTAHILTYQD